MLVCVSHLPQKTITYLNIYQNNDQYNYVQGHDQRLQLWSVLISRFNDKNVYLLHDMNSTEHHGPLDIFTEKQRGEYNKLIADRLDVTLSKAQRYSKTDNALRKLKDALSKRNVDEGDPDAIAKYEKFLKADNLRRKKSRGISNEKCDAGDIDALGKRAIKNARICKLYTSNKKARLDGDVKQLSSYNVIRQRENGKRKAKNHVRDEEDTA